MIGMALKRYWPFVLFSAVAMGPAFARALRTEMKQAVMMPYRNVIRMHFMIFILAGLHMAGVPDLALYPTLLLYFFPWDLVRDARKARAAVSPRFIPSTRFQ